MRATFYIFEFRSYSDFCLSLMSGLSKESRGQVWRKGRKQKLTCRGHWEDVGPWDNKAKVQGGRQTVDYRTVYMWPHLNISVTNWVKYGWLLLSHFKMWEALCIRKTALIWLYTINTSFPASLLFFTVSIPVNWTQQNLSLMQSICENMNI